MLTPSNLSSASFPNRLSDPAITANNVHGLDTLRAAAILLVFMYHYMVFVSHAPTFGWGSVLGWTGVDLFFVLSGYLIGNQIFAGLVAGRTLSLKAFYARRLLRTLPNYYVVLALYFLFPTFLDGRVLPPLWKFLTFTQNYHLQPGTSFSHAWSLCIEEQFYMVFPAVALLIMRCKEPRRVGWFLLALLILVGVGVRSVLWCEYGREVEGGSNGYYPHIYYASLCRFDEFVPGVAIALLKNFHSVVWERLLSWGRHFLLAGVLGMGVMGYLLLHFYQIEDYGYGFGMTAVGYSLVALCFGVLTIAALSPTSPLHRVRVPGATALARWSYALYLSHKPVAFLVEKVLRARGVEAASMTAIVVITCACLLVGAALYTLVERPFMDYRNRRFPTNFAA